MIRNATTRVCLAGVAAACMLWASAAMAITFNLPGYTQQIVATIPGSGAVAFGGVVEGTDGNAYVVGSYRTDAFRVTPAGVVTPLTLNATNTVLGVGIVGTKLFVGQSNGRIDTFDIALPFPPATFLTTVTGSFIAGNGNADFAVAPAGFGAFGGQLISCNGGVYAVNPATGARTDILNDSAVYHSSLGFGPSGVLYVVDYTNGRVLTVSAAGVSSVFATLPGAQPDGLAVHPGTGDVYVIDSGGNQIFRITPAGVVSTFATGISVSGGFFPSGIAFSNDGTTLYYLTDIASTFQLATIKGFTPVVPVPVVAEVSVPAMGELGLLLLATLLALTGVTMARRARR